MPEYAKPLGNAIRQARLKSGLTQVAVAEKVGIDQRTVLNIENGNGNPKMEVLYPLVRALEVDPWEIFYSELEHDNEAFRKLRIMLKDCNNAEIAALLPIVDAAITIVKTKGREFLEPV